jgi:hypothetical protein
VSGQTKILYSASIKGGISKPNTLNRAYLVDENGFLIKDKPQFTLAAVQNYGPMFSAEASIIEKIKDWKISFEQGLGIESKTFYGSVAEWFDTEGDYERYKASHYSLTIPVKVRYEPAKWAALYIGANNIFNVYQSGSENLKPTQNYNVRGIAGFDLMLSEKYVLGCEYSYDITPFSKWKDYDVSYRFEIIALKLGFVF